MRTKRKKKKTHTRRRKKRKLLPDCKKNKFKRCPRVTSEEQRLSNTTI
jgi:hypothetical protein